MGVDRRKLSWITWVFVVLTVLVLVMMLMDTLHGPDGMVLPDTSTNTVSTTKTQVIQLSFRLSTPISPFPDGGYP